MAIAAAIGPVPGGWLGQHASWRCIFFIAYLEQPKGSFVVLPDNRSREELNATIRSRMREAGTLHRDSYEFVTLVPRDVSGADLLKASLRHRPDRILVGEVRDGAAYDLLQALNTGHAGSISTPCPILQQRSFGN